MFILGVFLVKVNETYFKGLFFPSDTSFPTPVFLARKLEKKKNNQPADHQSPGR